MPVHSELFKTVKSIFADQSTTLLNVIALVVIGAIEAFVSNEKLFVCPSTGYSTYGWAFILGPGVIFMLISWLLRDDFRKRIQGCCHKDVETNRDNRWCPCSLCPRWRCSGRLFQIIAQSLVVGSMWVSLAFFHREYYACAMLGNKAVKETKALLNIKSETEKTKIKLSIEEEFTRVYDESQYVALVLVAVILSLTFVAVTVHYCCYQRPHLSLPTAAKYEKLEAEAAVQVFKEKMKDYAQKQGQRKAELYFSQNDPNVLIETYNDLRGESAEYNEAFSQGDNAQVIEAQAARKAFDAQAMSAGKDKVEVTFMLQTYKNLDKQQVKNDFIKYYPITSGNRDNEYVLTEANNQEGVPLQRPL